MNDNKELILKEECFAIIGSCMRVHSEMGCGFLEAVYQEFLEIKAVDQLTTGHQSQMLNYLSATGHALGLLVNFGSSGRFEWQRIANT